MTTSTAAILRRARLDDVPAILEISNWAAVHTPANFSVGPEPLEAWQDDWRGHHERYPWIVAIGTGERVVGFAKASPWKGRCAYAYSAEVTVYVHPDHQGGGIGHALYGRLIPLLQAQGYRSLLGGITLPNDASVRLHESFGFTPAARFERIGWKFDRWHDVGYWQLSFEDAPPAPIRTVSEVW